VRQQVRWSSFTLLVESSGAEQRMMQQFFPQPEEPRLDLHDVKSPLEAVATRRGLASAIEREYTYDSDTRKS